MSSLDLESGTRVDALEQMWREVESLRAGEEGLREAMLRIFAEIQRLDERSAQLEGNDAR
jgi:hypothetical protein